MRGDETYGIIRRRDENEDAAIVRKSGHPILRVFQVRGTRVVLGHGSKVSEEVHIDRTRQDGVPVERRTSGGCAVVLDEGNVVVAVTLPVEGLGDTKLWFRRCTDWLADGLERAGIRGVGVKGISDLVIGDKKIAGTAVHRSKGIFTFGASLLVTADLHLIDRYLPHPPREPEYRQGRSHLDFVTNLHQEAGIANIPDFIEKLRQVLSVDTLLEWEIAE
jgi:lipoate-protein ligase A